MVGAENSDAIRNNRSAATKRPKAAQDLVEALERLKTGKPTHPELVDKALDGKLKINVRTVALEAGRSRTLIGKADCKYPDVRRLVQEASMQGGTFKLRAEAVKNSALRVRELEEKIRVKDSALAAAMNRIEALESRLKQYESVDPKVTHIRRTKRSAR